jgi:two-component system CheB/CheR fusion protein
MIVEPEPPSRAWRPIVGVGARRRIAPFLEMLRSVGASPGVAFVYVLHQEKHDDRLAEVVTHATPMSVIRAEDGLVIQPDRVYVAPSDSFVTVMNGHLATRARAEAREMPIDQFLRSLAEDQGSRAIGVVCPVRPRRAGPASHQGRGRDHVRAG